MVDHGWTWLDLAGWSWLAGPDLLAMATQPLMVMFCRTRLAGCGWTWLACHAMLELAVHGGNGHCCAWLASQCSLVMAGLVGPGWLAIARPV